MGFIRIFLIVFIFGFSMNILSQDKISLLKEKLELASNEDKPKILNSLAKYSLKINREESLSYANEAIKLSEENGDVGEEMTGYLNKAKALCKEKQYKGLGEP